MRGDGPEPGGFGGVPWARRYRDGRRHAQQQIWSGGPSWADGPPPWASETWAARRDEFRNKHRGPPGAVVFSGLFHVIGSISAARDGNVFRPMDVLSYALLLIGPLALIWMCRSPVVVLAVASAASIGFATFAVPRWTFAVAPFIALYNAVKSGHRRRAVVVAGAGYLAYLAITRMLADPLGVPEQARPEPRIAVLTAVGLALAVVLGSAAKVRSEVVAQVSYARAEQAKARAEQERRQASEERLRIARELHDVLGHHLSLINVQAGVGLHLMDNRPEQAREALSAIKTASAEALREVRAVLGVLRPEEEAAPRQPALGLARLADLTADAGLVVTTTRLGQPRDLPAEVDRAAYRIVQEALTNVRRHACAGSAAQVTVDYRDTEVVLSVRNDGPAPASPAASPAAAWPAVVPAATGTPVEEVADAAGSGIAGMRARAGSLGGTLEAGLLPDGGYLVRAVLPTKGHS